MELSCNQENLKKGIDIVNRIITNRASLPVLNNILLSTDNGRLKLSATDLEIGITTWIGAKVTKEGSITVPARLLTDYIGTNDDKKINFSTKEDTLNLKSDRYQANIKGVNSAEFPLIPEIKDKKIMELDAKKLQLAIGNTVFACAVDETRPVLTGVFFKLKGEDLKLVATDSYRLAEATSKLTQNHQEANVLIPAHTMSELSRILSLNPLSKTAVSLNENQILFSLGDTQIISRLIEGSFPDYEQIIPKTFQTKLTVDIEELNKSIKIASFFARESANNIKLNIGKDKKLKISAISPQIGDTVSEIMAENLEGEEVEIAFNAKFVLDILNILPDELVTLEMNGKYNPMVIKPAKTKGLLYIIMPLRVEE